jgi:hypothetical protein
VFFQACWDVLKEDIFSVFHYFHARGKFEKSLNATFIALIPKKSEVVDVKDFQHISLMRGVHKIIAKVLAHNLRMVVEISKPQNAFVTGRQILDFILIVNECMLVSQVCFANWILRRLTIMSIWISCYIG